MPAYVWQTFCKNVDRCSSHLIACGNWDLQLYVISSCCTSVLTSCLLGCSHCAEEGALALSHCHHQPVLEKACKPMLEHFCPDLCTSSRGALREGAQHMQWAERDVHWARACLGGRRPRLQKQRDHRPAPVRQGCRAVGGQQSHSHHRYLDAFSPADAPLSSPCAMYERLDVAQILCVPTEPQALIWLQAECSLCGWNPDGRGISQPQDQTRPVLPLDTICDHVYHQVLQQLIPCMNYQLTSGVSCK